MSTVACFSPRGEQNQLLSVSMSMEDEDVEITGIASKLLYCPFCGKNGKIDVNWHPIRPYIAPKKGYSVGCVDEMCPGAAKLSYQDLYEIVAIWNTRAYASLIVEGSGKIEVANYNPRGVTYTIMEDTETP